MHGAETQGKARRFPRVARSDTRGGEVEAGGHLVALQGGAMIDPAAKLKRLRETPHQALPLASVHADEAYQPRAVDLVPYLKRRSVELRSEEHKAHMRLALEASAAVELEPILCAEVAGKVYVIDGHHRLAAYRLAKRDKVPARVLPMEHAEAVLLSKLVNCTERALEMHTGQRTDAAWQALAIYTKRGTYPLHKPHTIRSVAAQHGVGKQTVQRMLARLPHVHPSEFDDKDLDPGTGWPRWQAVCRQLPEDAANMLQREEREIERTLKWLGGIVERVQEKRVAVGNAVMDKALQRAKAELIAGDPDLAEVLALAREDDTGAEF